MPSFCGEPECCTAGADSFCAGRSPAEKISCVCLFSLAYCLWLINLYQVKLRLTKNCGEWLRLQPDDYSSLLKKSLPGRLFKNSKRQSGTHL